MSQTRQGEANGNAKLTWDKVRTMRAKHAANPIVYSLNRLGAEFGVATSRVQSIIRGSAWKEP